MLIFEITKLIRQLFQEKTKHITYNFGHLGFLRLLGRDIGNLKK
jgi:hypothetical protein